MAEVFSRLMSLREAATLPGVSIYTVRRLIGAGQVKSVRISNREIWVKQRQIRDLLLAIEPGAMGETRSPQMSAVSPLVPGNSGADVARARGGGAPERQAAGALRREL